MANPEKGNIIKVRFRRGPETKADLTARIRTSTLSPKEQKELQRAMKKLRSKVGP